MHDSMLKKLEQLQNRINEIQDLLLDSKTIEDIDKYTLLNKEFSELNPNLVDTKPKFQGECIPQHCNAVSPLWGVMDTL